jgi:hypothetical protein
MVVHEEIEALADAVAFKIEMLRNLNADFERQVRDVRGEIKVLREMVASARRALDGDGDED